MIDKSIFALPGIKGILGLLAVLAALQACAVLGQSWALASALTDLWLGGQVVAQLPLVAIFFVCFVGRQGVLTAQSALLDRYAAAQADTLRQELLRKIFATNAGLVRTHGTGSVTAAVLEGVDQVETYFKLILPKIIGIGVIPLILLVAAVALDWVSGLIMFVAFPFIILYMIIMGHTAKEKASRQHRTFQIMSNHFIDTLRGIDTLKLFGISKRYGTSIFEVSERFREATMKTLKVANLSSLVLDLFATLSVAAVAFMLGMRLIDGSVVLFPALALLVIAPEYFRPIREFAADYHASLDGKNALISLQALIATADNAPDERPVRPWSEDASLALDSVTFSYPDFTALDGITLEAHGFQKVGIIGASGSGKSTLVNLLGGFCAPDEGRVLINGEDVGSLRLTAWQRQVVYIPQDPYLFHASLRDNLAFYTPDASDEDIAHAVETVGLQALVDELPEGLNTRIGEGARPLSGGQAQRIALARALLDRSRRVLLFDEPTAHLDIETEQELKERMLPLMEGRLVFFATHRLHWIDNMDLVVVMENGRVAECGTPEELRASQGAFARLAARLEGGAA
ncbi:MULTISPECIES: thiol reductant ABC exporter subunit CydD [Gordonibacter]|uniref:Thiol reductant ABC exporter subunit CydD n=1 Tax=Gordonibacter faecis TaxID=3047475 RepID=A0ABT7DQG0_9ACTN|nr:MULTISPECIES: thiol reductant ABC exporter subunit CydD [unclassified Gordonibacter]MDJ1650778.1 thiol reductant ABC exporter subunit CydD [Gordonibacter sp. KGMB12511]HIW77192.1 thiol reductant ABC exporter subunit CydD [Candidatus Gordonibacter avicola]